MNYTEMINYTSCIEAIQQEKYRQFKNYNYFKHCNYIYAIYHFFLGFRVHRLSIYLRKVLKYNFTKKSKGLIIRNPCVWSTYYYIKINLHLNLQQVYMYHG